MGLQARILEWVAISFSRETSQPKDQTWVFHTAGRFFTVWTTREKGKWKSQSCLTLRPHELYSPWNSPGQNIGVGSCSLLQGIFPTQGSNPGLPHCRQFLYQLSHKGSLSYQVSHLYIYIYERKYITKGSIWRIFWCSNFVPIYFRIISSRHLFGNKRKIKSFFLVHYQIILEKLKE